MIPQTPLPTPASCTGAMWSQRTVGLFLGCRDICVCVCSQHSKRDEAQREQTLETGQVWDQMSPLALASWKILSQLLESDLMTLSWVFSMRQLHCSVLSKHMNQKLTQTDAASLPNGRRRGLGWWQRGCKPIGGRGAATRWCGHVSTVKIPSTSCLQPLHQVLWGILERLTPATDAAGSAPWQTKARGRPDNKQHWGLTWARCCSKRCL